MRSRPPARAPAKRDEAKRRASTASSTMRASSRRPGKAISCRAPTKRAGVPELLDDGKVAQGHLGHLRILVGLLGCRHGCVNDGEHVAGDEGNREGEKGGAWVSQRGDLALEVALDACEQRFNRPPAPIEIGDG